ncbi:MAG: hypothetical protein AVDCRST_MAG87-2048, partial [uncultured Thermomicrobiales bacterium]
VSDARSHQRFQDVSRARPAACLGGTFRNVNHRIACRDPPCQGSTGSPSRDAARRSRAGDQRVRRTGRSGDRRRASRTGGRARRLGL